MRRVLLLIPIVGIGSGIGFGFWVTVLCGDRVIGGWRSGDVSIGVGWTIISWRVMLADFAIVDQHDTQISRDEA
jgi:hypothetical protein